MKAGCFKFMKGLVGGDPPYPPFKKWCYKANSFTRHLKNYFFCEMGLFTLHNCCVSWLLNFYKLKLDSQNRLTIPEFPGYHCM